MTDFVLHFDDEQDRNETIGLMRVAIFLDNQPDMICTSVHKIKGSEAVLWIVEPREKKMAGKFSKKNPLANGRMKRKRKASTTAKAKAGGRMKMKLSKNR